MNPSEVHDRMVEKGREKARTAARASTMDRLRKQVRAGLIVEHINKGNTLGKAEQLAITDPTYIKACDDAEAAELESGIAAVEYESAKAWLEVWRSLEATRREEMKLT